MDLVGPYMKGLGLEEETLEQNVIHRKPGRGIHLISRVASDVGVKHAIKQRRHAKRLKN